MATVRDVVRIARDIDALHDGDQERMAVLVTKVSGEVEQALGLRLTELEAAGKKVGNARAVVGDPRWDGFTDNDGGARLRCTVQGHLEF